MTRGNDTLAQNSQNETTLGDLIDVMVVPALIQQAGIIVYANEYCAELYKFGSKEEMIGFPILELIHPDNREEYKKRDTLLLDGAKTLPIIYQKRLTIDGSEIYVYSRGTNVQWRGENAILGIQVDTTDQKLAELALASNQHLLRSVLDASSVGVLAFEADGSCSLANTEAVRLLGHGDDSGLLGKHILEVFENPTELFRMKKDIRGLLRRMIETQERFEEADTDAIHIDGGEYAGAIRGQPIFDADTSTRYLVAFCNTTQRIAEKIKFREHEQAVRALQSELTNASQNLAMDHVSGVIAHELRQPLSAIMNAASAVRRSQALNKQMPDADTEEKLNFIYEQAERASAIIIGIRRLFERSGNEYTDESINAVIIEACTVSNIEQDAADVDFTLSLDEDLPTVRINRVQLQQVIYNLARNAMDAVKNSAEKRIEIGTAVDGRNNLRIWVQDSGPGLADEIMKDLFKPFSTTKRSGMGMGLYTCRTIIESHGGEITVDPGAGNGTRFTFTIPLP